jgi:hypothetical protein
MHGPDEHTANFAGGKHRGSVTAIKTSPSAPTTLQAVAGFALLFTVSFDRRVRPVEAGAAAPVAALAPFPADELAAYQALRDETERHVLGSAFIEAGRLTHLPIGRIALGPLAGGSAGNAAASAH